MKMTCAMQVDDHCWTPTPFWTWNMVVKGAKDVSIDCGKEYKTEAGALKAARRFAAKYGIRIEG